MEVTLTYADDAPSLICGLVVETMRIGEKKHRVIASAGNRGLFRSWKQGNSGTQADVA